MWDDEAGRVSRFVSLGAFGAEATGGKKPRVRWKFHHDIKIIEINLIMFANSGFTHFQSPHPPRQTPLQPAPQTPPKTLSLN